MKKITALLLAGIILFTACRNEIPENETEEIFTIPRETTTVPPITNIPKTTTITTPPTTTTTTFYTAPPEPAVTPPLLPPVKFYPYEIINERGNSVGNIINGGRVATQGDWVYYWMLHEDLEQDIPWGSYLMRSRLDGTQEEALLQGYGEYTNIIGDWIYFTYNSWYHGAGIYKVRTDGTELTFLVEGNLIGYVNVIGDWIYYTNFPKNPIFQENPFDETVYEGGSIYKARTDGTEKTLIINESGWYVNVVDDWIYYLNNSDRFIYKIRIDGTEITQLSNIQSSFINVVDEWIYYSTRDNDEFLYKIRIDGSENTQLNSINSHSINVDNGWIYFASDYDAGGGFTHSDLYKMCIDGSDITILKEGGGDNIFTIEDWIYYTVPVSPRPPFYRVRNDGTDNHRVEIQGAG